MALCANRSIKIVADVSPNEACYDGLMVGKRVPITLDSRKMRFFLDLAK
jgi:iron(III) transport system ATP-binding protein